MHHLITSFVAITILLSSIFIPNCHAETTWQAIGPFGGQVNVLAIDPSNSQTVYAGTSGGGVFKSINGGASWSPVSSGMTGVLDISVLAIDPTNSQTVYAATGGGWGVYKSTSGGNSWAAASNGTMSYNILSLVIAPTNSQTLYAGTQGGGIFKSTNGGDSWNAVNNGMTITGGDLGTRVVALAIDPTNSQTVYAGTHTYNTILGPIDGVLYKSTNGGESWTVVNSGMTDTDVWSLVIDPTNPQTVYAGTWGGEVLKSTNGGTSFIVANNGITSTSVRSLAIDPNNSHTVYAGTAGGGLCKTTNGGVSWTAVNSGMTNTDVSSIAIDPTNTQTVYVGTLFGIFKSANGGKSWAATNGRFASTNIQSIAIDPINNQTVYAGAWGSGLFKSINGGISWTSANSGIANSALMSLAIDPTNNQTIYAGVFCAVYKSTNGGVSWTSLNIRNSNGCSDIYVYALAIDSNNSQTIYAGNSDGVLKTTNGGVSWSVANTGIVIKTIYALAIDPTNSQVVYAGTNGGGVFKTTNGGSSWTAANNGMTNAYVSFLAIDPSNSQTVYASTYGGGIFKSINGGASWTASHSGILLDTDTWKDIWSLAIDPINNQMVYAGTRNGDIYKSTNGGASWFAVNSGIAMSNVKYIAIDPSDRQTIYAGTTQGVFKTLLSDDVPAITGATTATFSEGVSGSFSITASGWPAPEFSISGTLPSGVSFDTTTGILSGTPASGTAGTYPLIVTAMNGIPPDAVRGITLTVLPATSLTASVISPSSGTRPSSLAAITGTSSGTGLSRVEAQVTDGTYYLQTNGSFALTPTWLTASGTTSWSLNTASVSWREGITYTIYARASNGSTTSMPSSSTFTIVVPTSKTATILSITLTPDSLRTGGSTTISGLLVQSDTTGVAGQTVTLIITPPSTAVNPNPAPIVTNLATDGTGAFTSGALSLFSVPGVYMIQARFEGNSTLASSFTSGTLGVTSPSGYAIIVTGKTSDNTLIDMHTASTDTIYSTLVNKRGFLPENIQYLKSTTGSSVTKQQVQDAITVWAKNKLITAPAPLYLIMIDHGSTTGFLLGAETLTPDQLKGYLDTLEGDPQIIASGTLTNHNRIIMIGACYSGIFVSKLSKTGRIVITSANTDEQSIAGFSIYNSGSNTTYYGGEYFIDALFSYLGRGDTLSDAFTQSSNMVELRDPRKVPPGTHADVYDTLAQHPLLDDNGDARASYILGTDGLLAANLRLGVGIRSLNNPADITAVTETTTIPAAQTTETPLWLRVNDNSRIAKAWMEIRTPITSVSSSGGSGQVIPRLITLPLYYDGIQWNGSYNFPNAGTYNILYYTQDNETNDIAPARSSVVYRQLTNNTAPAGFTLTLPNDGEGLSGIFPLTWQEVTSLNKITYTLHVATDQNFATEVYKEENIPQAATYMPRDALKNTQTSRYYCQNGESYCYWKVQAIDNYGAITASNTRSFTIVSTNALPVIIKGYVRDAITGVPIAGANVTAGSSQFTTMPNGYFVLPHLTGSLTLTATATGYNAYSTNLTVGDLAVTNVTVALTSASIVTNIPGDLDGDGAVTVADAIIALQVMAGMQPATLRSDFATSGADIDGDGKVTQSELLYILQKTAGAR